MLLKLDLSVGALWVNVFLNLSWGQCIFSITVDYRVATGVVLALKKKMTDQAASYGILNGIRETPCCIQGLVHFEI